MKKLKSEKGAFIVLWVSLMTILLGFAAYSIDLGYTWYEARVIQNASDMAALAAVNKVQSLSDLQLKAEANTLISSNELNSFTEVETIQCGKYFPESKEFRACA